MDPRLKLLSYSSFLTLHSCPRKYELYKLNAPTQESEADQMQNVTFAFGHIVGEGIQNIFAGMSLDEVVLKMFLGWHADLEESNDKQKKSFYLAVAAIQRFDNMRMCGFLKDWEVLTYNGKPACELGFNVHLPDGFNLRGYVDAVLRNTVTGKVMIVECKTSSSASVNPATYKNSAQAIGYSIVLDVVAPDISSYEVLYLVYLTKSTEYETYIFAKSYLQRALWIRELLLDVEMIKMYAEAEVFPMHGESCFNFYRECEYMNLCTLKTEHMTTQYDPVRDADNKVYDIHLDLMDLVNAQIEKNTASTKVLENTL